MSKKLILNIADDSVVRAAESFAASKGISLSHLIEDILRSLLNTADIDNKARNSDNLLGAFNDNSKVILDDLKWEYLKEKYEIV